MYFLGCGRMTAREVETMGVVLQEERLEMRQRVLFSEESPHAFLTLSIAAIKLMRFHLRKFRNQLFVDDEVLFAILAGRLVLMRPNSRFQEFRHPEVGISQQCRDARDGSHHLCIECPATVAHQHIGLFAFCQFADKGEGLFRMHRQVGGQHLASLESLS